MKVLCVGNALKGSMSSRQAAEAMAQGAINAGASPEIVLMSDGGDGFLDAYDQGRTCVKIKKPVLGPQGYPIDTTFIWDETNKTAVIETSLINGLALVAEHQRHTVSMTSAGLADILVSAMQYEPKQILIGLGGSASTDGGYGLLSRLEFLITGTGHGTAMRAVDLPYADFIDINRIKSYFSSVRLTVCTDVTNPLLGPNGTATVFAGQKGACTEDLLFLENALTQWADLIEKKCGGGHYRDTPGAGAAGGLGFAFSVIGANLTNGSQLIANVNRLPDHVANSDVIFVSEGKFDSSSLRGKAPWFVAECGAKANKRMVILCGAADVEASIAAKNHDIDVIEFGNNFSVREQQTKSFSAIEKTVEEYLKIHAAGNS